MIQCKCGVELHDLEAIEAHSEECPAAYKEGPPYYGSEIRWWIEQDPGMVVALHAVYAEEFQTATDGLYVKLYDEGKSYPKKLLRGRIAYVGEDRRQILRGMAQVTFSESWQGEPITRWQGKPVTHGAEK